MPYEMDCTRRRHESQLRFRICPCMEDRECNVLDDKWIRVYWVPENRNSHRPGSIPRVERTSVPGDGGPNQRVHLTAALARHVLRPADPARLARSGLRRPRGTCRASPRFAAHAAAGDASPVGRTENPPSRVVANFHSTFEVQSDLDTSQYMAVQSVSDLSEVGR